MPPRKGLLSRVKNRLSGLGIGVRPPPPGIGPGFSPAYEEEWNELVEQVDNYTQKLGAAVVQTWEVGAAELGRAVIGLPNEKSTIERYSDALVPTLSPFQDLHKKCSGAMAQGLAAGTDQNSMAAATAPLHHMVDGLGTRAQEGWAKTADYLGPVFDLTRDPAKARQAFLAVGPEIAKACDDAQGVLKQNLDGIPQNPKLWSGVCDSFDNWQLRLVRGLEIAITRAARELVAEVKAARA